MGLFKVYNCFFLLSSFVASNDGKRIRINAQGQKLLESIINHSERLMCEKIHSDFGKVIDIFIPGKGGVRFTVKGEMIGFLEPKM